MGVTIHYRGRIRDLAQVETFEDRIVEVAVEFGGYARIWRSASEKKKPPRRKGRGRGAQGPPPERIVRGVLLDLAPGVDTVSFLISPEGWLLPMTAIEDAEEGRLKEPPYVFVKTQFGTVESHVALVELLAAMRKEFLEIEVLDEGGYWETRDLAELRRRRGVIDRGLKALGDALRKDRSLSAEAKEDPEILAAHVARLAEQVHKLVTRPPEHPPARFADDEDDGPYDPRSGTEEEWDNFHKERTRKELRLSRAMDERMLRGEDAGNALEDAMRDEGIVDLPPVDGEAAPPVWDLPDEEDEDDADAPWRKSLEVGGVAMGEGDDPDEPPPRDDPHERHPLLKRMKALTLRVLRLPERKGVEPGGPMDGLVKGIMEMSGGLAQVLMGFGEEEERNTPLGLTMTQLKRALRGAAFARGALPAARAAGVLGEADYREIWREVETIERSIQVEVEKTRRRWREKRGKKE